MKSFLRYSILAGIFFLPFTPLLVTSSLIFPFVTTKAFAFRIIVEIIFLFWIAMVVQFKEFRPRLSAITIASIIFLILIGLADLFGENPAKSFWSNFERMEGYFTLLHLGALFLVTSSILNTENLWKRLFQTSIVTSFLLSIYGLLQAVSAVPINQGASRIDGLFGNAAYFGAYLAIHFFLALFLLIKHVEQRGFKNIQSWLYLGLMAIQFWTILLTGTRGSIVGVTFGLAVASILALFGKDKIWKRAASIFILSTILIIGLFSLLKNNPAIENSFVLNRLKPIITFDFKTIIERDAESRLLIWNVAWQGVKEKPLLGWGQENFNLVFNKYYSPKLYGQEQWFDRVHNFILDWLIAGGFLGLLSYLGILIVALWLIFKNRSPNSLSHLALIGFFTAYLFQNLFVFDQISTYIFFVLILSYIQRNYTNVPVQEKNPQKKSSKKQLAGENKHYPSLGRSVFSAAIILSIIFVYKFNLKPILASWETTLGFKQSEVSLEKSTLHFKKALGYKTFADPEIRENFVLVAEDALNKSFPFEEKKKFIMTAKDELDQQIRESPKDARYLAMAGQLAGSAKSIDAAIYYFEKALALSPKKQTLRLALGSAYISKGEYSQAKALLKETYEMEPRYLEARSLYALSAFYSGEDSLAHELMKGVYGPYEVVPEERFIDAYFSKGQYVRVLKAWQAWAGRYPEILSYRLSVAASYLLLGNRNSAVNELKRAMTDFPEFKSTGELYIKEILAGRNPDELR